MSDTFPRVPIPRNGVDYRGKVVLAPMVRSGELPSRLLALRYGADLVWGPETVDRAMIGTTCRENKKAATLEFTRTPSHGTKNVGDEGEAKQSVIYRIHTARESKRLIFQLGTAKPELAVQAAHIVAPYVAGIDVNSGCPKPFSTEGGMGAALLSDPDRLCSILEALVREVGQRYEIGISVKIRLLATEQETRTLVERLCRTGITGLTIHCRTRPMRKNQRAIRDQLRMIGEICRAAGVACLMNGDVENRDEAERLAHEFNVDGAMIATAAEKNSSVFRRKANGGTAPWQEVIREYLEEAITVDNRWGNTKFLLCQIMPGKEQASHAMSQARNYEHVCRTLGYNDMLDKARALDEKLGLTYRETRSEQKTKAGRKQLEASKAAGTPSQSRNEDTRKRQKIHNRSIEQGDYHTDLHHDIVAPALTV